jgi:hypothetical protein
MSIRAKLVLAIVLTLGASGLASAALVRLLYQRSARTASEDALRGAAAAYEQVERGDVERLSTALDVLVHNPAVRESFAARDRERLLAVSLPIHQSLKADHGIGHMNFIEIDTRRMFLRPHLPAKFGDVIDRASLVKGIARLETVAGKELGKSEFALRVGRPFFADGKPIGYVELGEGITHFLGKVKAQTGDDIAMFIQKKLIDQGEWARTRGAERNSWADFADVVVVNATTAEPIVDAAAIAGGGAGAGTVLDEAWSGPSLFARGVFPVRDSSGSVVGGLVVRHDITALYTAMRTGVLQALGFLLGLALLASLLVYLLVDRLIFRRLGGMMGQMEDLSVRLAGGDYGVAAAVRPTRDDEIGRFEAFFGDFLGLVGNTLRSLSERQRPSARAPAPAAHAAQPPPLPPVR